MQLNASKRERVLLGLVLLAVALYGFVMLVHRPLFTGLAEAREQHGRLRATLAAEKRRLASAGDVVGRAAQVRRREERLEAMVPGKHAAGLFVHYLSRSEQAAQVYIQSISAAETRPSDDLVELDLELAALGTWLEQVHFLQELEQVPLLFRIHGWEMAHRQGEEEEVIDLPRLRPELVGTYRITVYFRPHKPQSTDNLGYAPAGRDDPFETFVQVLQERFNRDPRTGHGQPAQLG